MAPPIQMTAERARAAVREPGLLVMLSNYEDERMPHHTNGVIGVCDSGACNGLSPDQVWRRQRAAEARAEADDVYENAMRRSAAPKGRAEILRIIAARGKRFTAAELPK